MDHSVEVVRDAAKQFWGSVSILLVALLELVEEHGEDCDFAVHKTAARDLQAVERGFVHGTVFFQDAAVQDAIRTRDADGLLQAVSPDRLGPVMSAALEKGVSMINATDDTDVKDAFWSHVQQIYFHHVALFQPELLVD